MKNTLYVINKLKWVKVGPIRVRHFNTKFDIKKVRLLIKISAKPPLSKFIAKSFITSNIKYYIEQLIIKRLYQISAVIFFFVSFKQQLFLRILRK